jgi:RNA polymerase sigma-70 factor (ECF subfamily)
MMGGSVASTGCIPPDPATLLDATLIQKLVDGCEGALAALYDRYAGLIFGAVARLIGDRGAASDVVQETFLGLWDRAETYDATRGTLRAWLLRIAHNRAIDHLRSERRHEPAAVFSSFEPAGEVESSIAEWLTTSGKPVGMGSSASSPEEFVDEAETHAWMLGALRGLAPLERSMIELAYGEELSQSEIATRLGWPIGTVKTRTRRALRHLRESVEGSPAAHPFAGRSGVRSVALPASLSGRNRASDPKVPA